MTTRYKPASPRQPAVRQQTSQTATDAPPGGNTAQNAGGWTPEPWRVNAAASHVWIDSKDGGLIAEMRLDCAIQIADANAERIVACVNSLAGIRNPAAIPAVVEALRAVLASAFPNETEQPAMFAAWTAARQALAALDRQ